MALSLYSCKIHLSFAHPKFLWPHETLPCVLISSFTAGQTSSTLVSLYNHFDVCISLVCVFTAYIIGAAAYTVLFVYSVYL